MPGPEPSFVTFEVDGRDITAPEGAMLVDGAKYGDVEIPVFCYEPKLGPPVGACRMCLVEIEGMPKLQTACSTAIKDGMVVSTSSERVRQAQNAVVEFLLVNHPLDCPVCDKGGECPLQDISFGWGAGRSRFIEPKRHFRKPLALSPLVAIDRERCILCYRCVRFSQEVAEDHQLVLLERGDHSYVGTDEGRPYVAPFSGNIVELCPVGALTSAAYRFRARPWDIEGAGSICTLCPSQCNVELTVRDDNKVMRVLARDNEEVDDGWLCDKGRFGYQAIHAQDRITEPLIRDGGVLRAVPWERALSEAAQGLERAGERTAALAGGGTTNEEGFLLQRLLREGLGSPHVDSRLSGRLDPGHARLLARPDLSASVSDIDQAGAILVLDTELVDEAPILELRARKAARRNGAKLVVATSRPSALDPSAAATLRFRPGAAEGALGALLATLGSPLAPEGGPEELAAAAGLELRGLRRGAELLRDAGSVVVLWGERLSEGERGRQAVAALLTLARELDFPTTGGAGLIEVPRSTNSRGLREAGCLPNLLPGLEPAEADSPGLAAKSASEIAAALGGELSALVLMGADPLRTHPERAAWESALDRASFVVAFAQFADDSVTEHADVIFPAESYAEKDGTVTHPDGRVQRLRQAIGHPGEVHPGWSVLAELSARLGADPEVVAGALVTERLAQAVPFLEGLTLAEVGGRGVRWPEREAAAMLAESPLPEERLERPPAPPEADGGLRLGTASSLWAGRETEKAPALRFLQPRQRAELSAADARRLGIASGDQVDVSLNGTRVRATAALRDAVPEGTVFLIEGTSEENATVLANGAAPTVEVAKA